MCDGDADLASVVRAYNEACSRGTVDDIMAFFAENAVIYDLNHPPVVGRDAIGRFWGKIRAKWGGATWHTDAAVADAATATAAAEWTMYGVSAGKPFRFHGVDMFSFDGALISEVRQYWRFDAHELHSGLVGHPAHSPTASGVERNGA
jgi:ketosteroid isomerase-like protein